MTELREGQLLRIYISERHHVHGRPLYESIVKKAREMKLAGATVIKGIMGYGRDSNIHSTKVLRLSDDLPVVVEIVDETNKIQSILPFLEENVNEGLITLEKVQVVRYHHDGAKDGGK